MSVAGGSGLPTLVSPTSHESDNHSHGIQSEDTSYRLEVFMILFAARILPDVDYRDRRLANVRPLRVSTDLGDILTHSVLSEIN